MENCRTDNVEANENINTQCDCERDRVGARRPQTPCVYDKYPVAGAGAGYIDSSLLFFFLLLVAIVCQSDCDIDLNTLLWFFLLLVVLYNRF